MVGSDIAINPPTIENANLQLKNEIQHSTKFDKYILNNKDIENLSVSNVYMDRKELPLLKVKNELFKECVALVDSGASRNFLDYEFVKSHQLENYLEPTEFEDVVAANKKTISVKGELTLELQFKLRDEWQNENIRFLVLENINHKMILGFPFVKDHGNKVDWENIEKETETPEIPDIEEQIESSDENDLEETQENELIGINSMRAVRRNLKNVDNYPLLLFVQSVEEKENNNVLEEPYDGVDGIRKKIHEEFRDVVTNDQPTSLPPQRDLTHRIILIEPTKSTYRRQYKLSYSEKQELNKQVDELLKQGFIKPSSSPFNSPVLFVKKKDGSMRMCVDYRLLNNNTVKDKFPIPRIDELITCFGGASVFSKLDLMSGYFQVRIAENDMEKTAFSTDYGHYEWVVMPFGLTNAPSTFQRMMNRILAPYLNQFVQVYLDDIIIYSKTVEEHYSHIEKILELLRRNKLIAKKKKCSFYFKTLGFLGHLISSRGIQTDPAKIDKIKSWPIPKNVKDAQSFLGLAGYYRRFIKDYSKIASPIMEFANKKCVWKEPQDKAFEELKGKLINAPILVHPIWEDGYTFVVHTDACGTALGYVLEQLDPDGKLRGVIAYGSRKLIGSELNYSIYDREFLAVVEALKNWRYYLLNRHFVLKTDHRSLVYLKRQNAIDSHRVARWLDYLADYDFTIQYVKGPTNSVADALSRYPYEEKEVGINTIESVLTPNQELLERIIKSYDEDNEIKEIYDILKENLPIPKSIHNHIKHYSIEDNLLYFSVVKGGNDRRIVVSPKSKLVQEIIGNAHDGNSAGHFGYFKTYMRLHPMFYWPNMLKSVKRYCQRCTVCQKTKPETTGQRGLFSPLPIPEGRWTDISLDFVTGVPRCKNGHDMILVVVDRFTKMAHFIPTRKTATAEQCAKLMVDNCFKLHGIPKRMVSDKDIRFMNKFWFTVYKIFGTSLLFSTTNHPQTDGQTERTNRILNQLLRNYASNDLYSWDKWLSMAEFAYNSSHQVSIGSSPFEVCYGYLPDSPMFISSSRVSSRRYSNKAEEFALEMKVIMENVKENMIEAQRSQETQHNKSRVYETFEVGDWILLHKDAYGSDRLYYKIQPVYYGPYKVVKKISDNAYEVDLPKTNKKDRVINVRWLRRFLQTDKQFPKVPPRTIAEARSRLTEIIGIAGIDETNDTLDVYWKDCDPCHSSSIPFSLFLEIPEDLQRTLWDNAKAIDKDNKLRDEVSKAAG